MSTTTSPFTLPVSENSQVGALSEDVLRKRRRMTYQITMRGCDGIVMASDRMQRVSPYARGDDGVYVENDFDKIFVDPSGRFAWAFAGERPSFKAAQYIGQELANGIDDFRLKSVLQDCCDRGAKFCDNNFIHTVIFADGRNREMFFAVIQEGSAQVSTQSKGICFTGQSSNRASVLPSQYYDPNMSVGQLSRLAAYSVIIAGRIDPLIIGGLDVFVCRYDVGRFEPLDRKEMERDADALDSGIRDLIQSIPR